MQSMSMPIWAGKVLEGMARKGAGLAKAAMAVNKIQMGKQLQKRAEYLRSLAMVGDSGGGTSASSAVCKRVRGALDGMIVEVGTREKS